MAAAEKRGIFFRFYRRFGSGVTFLSAPDRSRRGKSGVFLPRCKLDPSSSFSWLFLSLHSGLPPLCNNRRGGRELSNYCGEEEEDFFVGLFCEEYGSPDKSIWQR